MFTNLFLERFEDWDDEKVFYTTKDVEEALNEVEKEIKDETTGIQ